MNHILKSRLVMHVAPGHRVDDTRLYHLECQSLADAGYSVQVLAQGAAQNLEPRIRFHSLGDYRTSLSWRLFHRAQRDLAAYRLAVKSDIALFHFHSLEFIPWARRLIKILRRPVIFDCREDFESYARQRRGIPGFARECLAHLVQKQLRLAAASCDAIIVADAGTGKKLEPYARRLSIIHNFPRVSLFPKVRVPNEDKRYDIAFFGSLPRYHLNVCLGIDAALVERGCSAHWRLIGLMPDEAWFREELARRNSGDRFHISGIMPHDQIPGEISQAKVGLIPLPDLPKFHNNVPQKLFEYMALSMPVVMSDLPPSKEFVGDGSCAVMVPPNDYAAYAEAIVRLLEDPERRESMGQAGRKRVEQRFNWEKESTKLLALYEELLPS